MMLGTCKGGHVTGYPPSHLDWNATGQMLRTISVRYFMTAPEILRKTHTIPVPLLLTRQASTLP